MHVYKTIRDIPIAKVSNLLSEITLTELKRLAFEVSKIDDKSFECTRGFNRKITYDPMLLKYIQRAFMSVAEDIFGRKLKESHTVLACYYEGGNCYYHYDKPDHTYVINLAINKNVSWPLMVEANFYDLEENEALFFSGAFHKHGRFGSLKKNEFVHNAFIYYIDVDM